MTLTYFGVPFVVRTCLGERVIYGPDGRAWIQANYECHLPSQNHPMPRIGTKGPLVIGGNGIIGEFNAVCVGLTRHEWIAEGRYVGRFIAEFHIHTENFLHE